MTISTCIGIKSITKVSYIAVFTILIFGILSITYALNSKSIDILNSFGLKENISFIVGLEMVIGSYISGSITTPNFAKYGKNPFFIGIICFMAFLLGNGLMIVFGAASNILVGGNDIFDIFTYFGFNLLGIIVLGLNIWSSCDNGLYSAGLEFENIFKIEHKKIILILGLLSTLCSYYLYSNFISFLSIMNYTLPPVGVVLITNYLFKGNYSKNKINLFNCLAVAAGIISSFFIKYGIALVVAAWFEILLGVKVPEQKAKDYQIEETDRPEYIKQYLEDVMRLNRNMRGFKSLRALYLFEKGEKLEAKADELEEKTGKCYDGYRQTACFLRCDADMAEDEYRELQNQKKLIKTQNK